MIVSREALTLAQTPAPEQVTALDGLPAGLVWDSGRWECAECLTDGNDGRSGLLFHVGARHSEVAS